MIGAFALLVVLVASGGDAELTHFGCMLSFPGSAVQPWHSDGPHIRGCGEAAHDAADASTSSFYAPVHALNVFVPLVDLTHDKGPTEFVPGTHRDFDTPNASKIFTPDAGSAILFDYRVKHRGLSNRSTEDRPLLYLTYARPFWLDIFNFDKKRYANLPHVEERGGREERMQKRQKM